MMHTLSEARHFGFRFLAPSDHVAIFQLVVVDVLVRSSGIAGVESTQKDIGGALSVRLSELETCGIRSPACWASCLVGSF